MAGKLQLNDLVTTIAGKVRGLFAWPIVCLGMNGNTPTPMAVDSSGNVPTVPASATGTNFFTAVAASSSGTIPITAKSWTITFLTGTGTLGGVAVAAGFSDSDVKTPSVAIAYTTDAASTAYLRYSTT